MNGDLQGKVQRVQRELQQLKYTGPVDEVGLRLGDPVAFLPLLHFALLKFSRHVAQCIHQAGYELQGKTDQKFVENAFRLFRDCFNVKTVLTPQHFLDQGFAERKLILISDVVQACKKIHNDEIRKERLAALKQRGGAGGSADSRLYEPARKTPEIKIIKGGQEVRQVVQAQHLPGGSDGGHSMFKVKQQVVSPLPSGSRGSRGPAASAGSKSKGAVGAGGITGDTPTSTAQSHPGGHTPVTASRWAWGNHAGNGPSAAAGDGRGGSLGSPLEVTLRPGATSNLVGGVLGAMSTPIHNWFVNPAYNDTSPEPDTLRNGLEAANGAAPAQPWWAMTGSGAAGLGSSLTFPSLQAGGRTTAVAAQANDDDEDDEGSGGLQQLLHHVHGAGGLAGTFGGVGGWGQQHGAVQVVEVQPTSEVVVDASGLEDAAPEKEDGEDEEEGHGAGDDGEDAYGQDSLSAAQAYLQGQHGQLQQSAHVGGQVQQQPRYPPVDTATASMGGRHVGAVHAAPTHQPPMPQPAAAAPPAAPGYGLVELRQLDDRVWAVEKQLMAQVSELAGRVAELEKRGAEDRAAAERASSTQQARITVLEGRVRFLECELESCVRRGEYLAPAATAPQSAPTAAGLMGNEQGRQGSSQGWAGTSAAPTYASATQALGHYSHQQTAAATYHASATSAYTSLHTAHPAVTIGSSQGGATAHPYSDRASLSDTPMTAEAPTPTFTFQPGQTSAVLQQHVAATQEALARSRAAPAAPASVAGSGADEVEQLDAVPSQPYHTHSAHGRQSAGTVHAAAAPQPHYTTGGFADSSMQSGIANGSATGGAAGATAPPNFGSTSELISNLFNRYTAAQSFLQDLRSSSSKP